MRFRLTACPTETPVMWGWTHAPFLGGVIEGNILEDCRAGGHPGSEHDPRYIKSNAGPDLHDGAARRQRRSLVRAVLEAHRARGAKQPPVGLTLGYPPSHDPGELVVTAAGNRLEAPPASRHACRAC